MNNQTTSNSVYSLNSAIATTNPFVEYFSNRDPTPFDINFPIQKRWLNTVAGTEWILIGFSTITGIQQGIWLPLNASSVGLVWVEVTSPSQTMEVNHGYISDRNAGVVYALPTTAIVGDTIKVVGKNGISTILINSGQSIVFGTVGGVSFTGTTSLTGTYPTDSVELICITAGVNTIFCVDSSQGNWSLI